MTGTAFIPDRLFEGQRLQDRQALLVEDGLVAAILSTGEIPADVAQYKLPGLIAPGFVDLQINGGGGVMFNDAPSVETLQTIARANLSLGSTAILPTLITDTPDHTRAAIDATIAAIAAGTPGIAGLHLEGPHLSVARKGAHDPALIRPMEGADIAMLTDAAAQLPSLLVTLAPEAVSPDQIAALVEAGITVSLGHSDADFDTCQQASEAGATCVTHLFNAMSQLGARMPGLVGAALATGGLHAGLIADGIHVHPTSIAAALRAKEGPGEVFLVTDAMATAGSDITEFTLNGRQICRQDGRLTLADGTLAGADLDMATALQVMTARVGVPLEQALRMATSVPAQVLGRGDLGLLAPGHPAHFVQMDDALVLHGTWYAGAQVA